METKPSDIKNFDFPRDVQVLVVDAPYYREIGDNLLYGAIEVLKANGVEFDVVSVPGALEIPAMIGYATESVRQFDAYITLGCVIRGESYHFEIVCNESMRKIYDLVQDYDLALGNGILTVENMAQAEARAQRGGRNNGREAALAALEMLNHKFKFGLVK